MGEEEISMKIVNPRSAGIDIGSRSHWVAIGQGEKDYREFGVFNEGFLPDEKTEHLRTLCRHRSGLQDNAASTSKKMQKYLLLMNKTCISYSNKFIEYNSTSLHNCMSNNDNCTEGS
jgi:hypothetical protein